MVGGLTTLWLALGPRLGGQPGWWWFDFGALIDDLDLVVNRAALGLEGFGLVYWAVALALPPAGFALAWKGLRARAVGLDHELALARRAADRKGLMDEAEAIWAAAEDAETAGDHAAQVGHLDAYMALARRLESSADLRGDRIERIRTMARTLTPVDPDAAVRLLEEAKALMDRPTEAAALTSWAAMRGDLLRYGLGFGAMLLGVPLFLVPVGWVMWMLNMILVIVVIVLIIAVVFGAMGMG